MPMRDGRGPYGGAGAMTGYGLGACRTEGLTGITMAYAEGPGARGAATIPREGYPSYLSGINVRQRPVTPPEMAPATLRHAARETPVSAMVDRESSLAGLNVRQPPVTPPESYPATLQGLGDIQMDFNLGPAELVRQVLSKVMQVDKARLAALLIGYLTYKKLPIQQAFLASIVAPWALRPAIGCPDQTSLNKLVDGAEAVLAGLLAIGGGGYF